MHFLHKNVHLFGLTHLSLYIAHIFTFSSQIMFILTLLDANDPHETNNRTLVKSA